MFRYFGVAVNFLTVIIGCTFGVIIRHCEKSGEKTENGDNKEKLRESIMNTLAVCTILAAVGGLVSVSSGKDALVCVLSLTVGYIIGFFLHIQDNIERFFANIAGRIKGKNRLNDRKSPAEGIISATMIFCTGSMTLLGCLQSAANGDDKLLLSCHTLLIIKSCLDLVTACCLSISFGASVYFSSFALVIIQGGLVAASGVVTPFFDKIGVCDNLNCIGSMILILIAVNLFGIKKIKTADYIPSIFIVILASYINYLLF